jgi:hypothetical protein
LSHLHNLVRNALMLRSINLLRWDLRIRRLRLAVRARSVEVTCLHPAAHKATDADVQLFLGDEAVLCCVYKLGVLRAAVDVATGFDGDGGCFLDVCSVVEAAGNCADGVAVTDDEPCARTQRRRQQSFQETMVLEGFPLLFCSSSFARALFSHRQIPTRRAACP